MIDKEQVIKDFFNLVNSSKQAKKYGVTPARIRQIIYERIDKETRKKVMEARKRKTRKKFKLMYRDSYDNDPEFRAKMISNAKRRYYRLKKEKYGK